MTAIAVPITTALVSRINRREAEIRAAGKTMLMLAKEQGEDLLRLKEETPHGEFKGRIERETCLSYQTAAVYMKVAKEWDQKSSVLDFSTTSLRDFIDNKAKRKARPPLTREDAEYVLKINALVERGATEGERNSAEGKLDNFAQQFGRTSKQVIKEAEKLCPDRSMTSFDLSQKQKTLAKFAKLSQEEMLEVIWILLSKLRQERKQPSNSQTYRERSSGSSRPA